jgi:hypothetical protein
MRSIDLGAPRTVRQILAATAGLYRWYPVPGYLAAGVPPVVALQD